MKKWMVSYIIALAVQLSLCPGEESIRGFQTVDPILLERKVPIGYGEVFVQAGQQNNIDPVVLAAISAHESGKWKSRIARKNNNWMGLMTRRGPKSFGTPKESIFYAAKLLNQKPFKDRDTLSQIAPIYCANRPGHWKASVLEWENELREWQAADAASAPIK
jgi:Mannosyl-glycoprotein endo-beta-N-acetylglucosaminidase